jgi:flagellar hook-associated protein 1 FlgK
MSSTFLGLQIGKSGLSAAQISLHITGQNISNADTDGYTRQTVDKASVPAGGGDYLINQITAPPMSGRASA